MSDFSIQGNSFNAINISKIPSGKTNLFKEEALKDGADNVFFELNNGDKFIATGVENLVSKPIKEGTKVNLNGQEGIVSFVDNEINTLDEKIVKQAKETAKNMSSPFTHILAAIGGTAVGAVTYTTSQNIKAAAIAGIAITTLAEMLVFSSSNGIHYITNPDTDALNKLSKASPDELKQLEQSKIFENLLRNGNNYSQEAKDAFNMIQETLRPNEDFSQAANTYINLFYAEGSHSLNAQEAYKTIDSRLRPDETREEVANTYISILHAENGYSANALADFRLIDSRLQSGDSREFASKTFINLLRAESYSSTDARRAYKLSVSGSAEDCNK